MKVAVLFSGGKDSVLAAFCMQHQGHEVRLLTIEPAEYSAMFHHTNVQWCARQAREMGMPFTMVRAKGGSEQDELAAIKSALGAMGAQAVATGAIESEYQKQRIDKIAHELGIPSFSPLWRTGKAMLPEIVRYFEAYVSAVSAEGLVDGELGARFDSEFLGKIRRFRIPISPYLEGGEGETFVANAPFFRHRLKICKMEKKWDGARGTAEIKKIA